MREAGLVGASGRLRDLFDFLAERGPEAEPAAQAEIAREVFGQQHGDAEDATVRVYVHRLRKKLDDHYAANPPPGGVRIDLPSGVYAFRLTGEEAGEAPQMVAAGAPPRSVARWHIAALAAALLAALLGGYVFGGGVGPRANAIWQPVLASERPLLLVLGDYYLFGEIDPVRPDEGRLIRDFRVDSPEDLLRMQEAEPERFGTAEDVGLNYLPFQSAYALQSVAPLLAGEDRQVTLIAASELTSDMLRENDVVYLGLLSGMGLLEEMTFAGSSLRLGESYDELVDRQSGQRWASDEARRLASPAFYRDHAYVARYHAPGGALVTIVASERVTGARGIGPIVTASALPEELRQVAEQDSFEALFQFTGQQGADLTERLVLAQERE